MPDCSMRAAWRQPLGMGSHLPWAGGGEREGQLRQGNTTCICCS